MRLNNPWVWLAFLAVAFFVRVVDAKDITLTWDAVPQATGYTIYGSQDMETWEARDAGSDVVFIWQGVIETGIVYFRVGAYDGKSNSINYQSGVWYCGECTAVPVPTGIRTP